MSDERDSLPFNTTDSTYSSGGYVGIRTYNSIQPERKTITVDTNELTGEQKEEFGQNILRLGPGLNFVLYEHEIWRIESQDVLRFHLVELTNEDRAQVGQYINALHNIRRP